MNVITLKDYAKQSNVSYEAVRQQVNRYADELGDHIIKDGRQQFLDEDAVAFLDAKRQKNPVVVIQQDKDEQIEALEGEVKRLLAANAAQANQIAELAQWKAEKALEIAEANHRQFLLEEKTKELKALEAQNADLSADIVAKDKTLEDERKNAQRASQELLDARKQFEDEKHLLEQQIAGMKKASLWQRIRGWKE